MFEKFGEFDSYLEINMAAEGLKEEGDLKSLRKLAEENGLQDFVEDYINGDLSDLCNVFTAAIGKLEVEKKDAGGWQLLADDVADYLAAHCDDFDFAAAVRKEGKRISEAAKRIEEEARKNTITIPGGGKCRYCGPMKGFQLVRDYYKEN